MRRVPDAWCRVQERDILEVRPVVKKIARYFVFQPHKDKHLITEFFQLR